MFTMILRSPLINQEHVKMIRSNSLSNRESLLRKASFNAYLLQKAKGNENPGLVNTNSSGTSASRQNVDAETQSVG